MIKLSLFCLCTFCVSTLKPEKLFANESLSFQKALQLSLERSPTLARARAEYQGQVEKKRGSWGSVGPSVNVQLNDIYFDRKQEVQMGGGAPLVLRDDHLRTGSLVVTQPIVGLYGYVEKSLYEGTQAELRELNVRRSSNTVELQVAEAYLRAQSAELLVEVADASVQSAEAQVRDGEAILKVGRINQGDYLRLQVALSEAKARAAETYAMRDIVFANLREMTGVAVGQGVVLEKESPFQALVAQEPIPDFDGIMQAALENNPDYLSATTGKEIATFAKKLAYTTFLPSLNAFAQFDKNYQPSAMQEEYTRSYGLSLSWNLWSNGASVFATREASQYIAAAEAGVTGAEQALRLNIYQLLANLKALAMSVDLSKSTVAQASEAYRIEKAKFNSGTSSTSDLVLAEASLTAARGRMITSEVEYQLNRIRLAQISGKSLDDMLKKGVTQ